MAETESIPEMRIVSRREAIKAGLRFYFTGKPCPRGHVSVRYIASEACAECSRERRRRFYAENTEKCREDRKRYYEENIEKCRADGRRYYAENTEKCRAACSRWAEAHKEDRSAYKKQHRELHREEINSRERAARLGRLESSRARARGWKRRNRDACIAHKHKRRARIRASIEHYTVGDIARIKRQQRGRCACCRIRLGRIFARDHIISLSKGGTNKAGNIQLLCMPCNAAKHHKDPIDFMQSRGFLL